ncbi:MAG TPA: rod-binding protein [Acetobacteraceae bacterium]|nr:rod-binding protein [Acetobacteraceae bacterium]
MDFSPAASAAIAAGVPAAQVAKLRQAAQDFEAMALGQLLQPMFATVDMAHGAFGGGAAEEAMQPMLVDALAKNIAAHGGLGLAGPVFASMLRSQEAANGTAMGVGR